MGTASERDRSLLAIGFLDVAEQGVINALVMLPADAEVPLSAAEQEARWAIEECLDKLRVARRWCYGAIEPDD